MEVDCGGIQQGNHDFSCPPNANIAVIGSPLVGMEVINKNEEIAPLEIFQWFCNQEKVLAVMPVGLKGIFHELGQIFGGSLKMQNDEIFTKSSGPSTCFIVVYLPEIDQ